MPLGTGSGQTTTATTRGTAAQTARPLGQRASSLVKTGLNAASMVASNPGLGKYMAPLPSSTSVLSPWRTTTTQAQWDSVPSAAQVLAMQAAEAQQAMAQAQYNSRRNELLFNQNLAGSSRDSAIAQLRANTDASLAELAGARERGQIGLQGVEADRNYWNSVASNWEKENSILFADWAKQREFLSAALGIDLAEIDALTGFAGEDLALANRDAQLKFDSSNRQATSDATARGAITSRGFADTRNEILQQLGLSQGANDLNYRREISQLGTRKKNAQLTNDRGQQAITTSEKKRWEVDTARTAAEVNRGLTNADIEAQTIAATARQLGMQESALRARLEAGIGQANLDYASTIQAIQGALASNDETQRAAALAIASSLAGV